MSIFAASSLNTVLAHPLAGFAFTRMCNGMTQHPEPEPSAQAANGTTDESRPASPAGEPGPEPAVERSRFSQWLASFGLGELQNPLLTRARPPAPRRPANQ